MATVRDILTNKGTDVVSMVAEESVVNAARVMNERSIGGLIVTEHGKMIGIFTERDVLRRVVAERRDPATTTLREVMTSPVVRCRGDASLEECMAVMTSKRIRHLPVTEGDELQGVITSGDILAHQVREQETRIQFLNSYVFDLR